MPTLGTYLTWKRRGTLPQLDVISSAGMSLDTGLDE